MPSLRFLSTCVLCLLARVQVAGAEETPDMSEMAFGMVDADKSGKITKKEVKAFVKGFGALFLGEGLAAMSEDRKKRLIDEVFAKLDTSGDKKIDKDEATAGSGFVQELVEGIKAEGGDKPDL
mmetsp:Transcript_108549/g.305987  ORF Transcript_108549/g.305987 Transcript_108549/m.305987 type:complete len:123 (-) Transcript_108549:110-478(-)|eukprot:CAMPEP_0117538856 /NCGR_PEP_ID=MMETSP0784-20121206/42691_1 /TAXON_ID=39447 /ORGANISM="" /LENGTH=122 /DNA_ID=CAMNT_0005335477 /DNA_START=79 /DNA_END=447 /DNA_ORIENTATION=-